MTGTPLVICYPDIPARATRTVLFISEEDDYPRGNLAGGHRANSFRFAANGTTPQILYDMGPTGTAAAEYMILAHANRLVADTVTTALLKSSADNTTYTSRLGASASLSAKPLMGPQLNDLIFASGINDDIGGTLPTAPYRYWRLDLTATVAGRQPFSKLYFGRFFDFGVEPESYKISREPARENQFRSRTGQKVMQRLEDAVYKFTFTWAGVSDALIDAFFQTVMAYEYTLPGVFLYTRAQHQLLDGQRLVHCSVLSAEATHVSAVNDYNRLTVTFEEQIG